MRPLGAKARTAGFRVEISEDGKSSEPLAYQSNAWKHSLPAPRRPHHKCSSWKCYHKLLMRIQILPSCCPLLSLSRPPQSFDFVLASLSDLVNSEWALPSVPEEGPFWFFLFVRLFFNSDCPLLSGLSLECAGLFASRCGLSRCWLPSAAHTFTAGIGCNGTRGHLLFS